jgi:hypothetical protein
MPNTSFARLKLNSENSGLYALNIPLKAIKLYITSTKSGINDKAIPKYSREEIADLSKRKTIANENN